MVTDEIKRYLILGRKDMINLDSIFKSRNIILPTKVCIVKLMVFQVVMYRCESWTTYSMSITYSMSMNLCKLWERVKDRGTWHSAVH